MGYLIQALVAPLGVFPSSLPEDLEVIDLGENVRLIPLGTTVQERYEIPFLPLTDDGAMEIPRPYGPYGCNLASTATSPISRLKYLVVRALKPTS